MPVSLAPLITATPQEIILRFEGRFVKSVVKDQISNKDF